MWYSGIAIPVSATQHFCGLLEQSNEYSVRFMPVNGTCKASYRTATWFWSNAVDLGNCQLASDRMSQGGVVTVILLSGPVSLLFMLLLIYILAFQCNELMIYAVLLTLQNITTMPSITGELSKMLAESCLHVVHFGHVTDQYFDFVLPVKSSFKKIVHCTHTLQNDFSLLYC